MFSGYREYNTISQTADKRSPQRRSQPPLATPTEIVFVRCDGAFLLYTIAYTLNTNSMACVYIWHLSGELYTKRDDDDGGGDI